MITAVIPLRKFLRDDSVISVKLYLTSFFSLFSNYLQKIVHLDFKSISVGSMFGKNIIDCL